jgi:hypothetical protein
MKTSHSQVQQRRGIFELAVVLRQGFFPVTYIENEEKIRSTFEEINFMDWVGAKDLPGEKQGCQIDYSWCDIPKRGKIYQIPEYIKWA